MEQEKLESLLIDYIDNKLNAVDRRMVEQELVSNPSAHKLYDELKEVMEVLDRTAHLQPTVKLKSSFDAMLSDEITNAKKSRTIFFQPAFYRVAAAIALLILGGGIGFYISKENDKRLAAVEQLLKEQEVQLKATREMMAMLSNDQSASQRMQGINVALTMEKPADEIVTALVKTMNEDPNSNVRLAALEALSNFVHEKDVRSSLITSLSNQKDPVVQIALIQLLVKMKEKGVVDDLKKIVEDEGTMQAVKDEAYSGIMRLS
jgi:hypothetical protein